MTPFSKRWAKYTHARTRCKHRMSTAMPLHLDSCCAFQLTHQSMCLLLYATVSLVLIQVVGIIDHHFDEGKHLKMPETFMQMLPAYSKPVLFHHSDPVKPVAPEDEATPDHVWRKIRAAGSTASLIAEEALKLQADEGVLKHHICVFLLSAIAADTRGFDPGARLYTETDVYAAKGLLSALQTAQGLPEDTRVFLSAMHNAPGTVEFAHTMKIIEDNFDYSPVPFTVDGIMNDPGLGEGPSVW